MHNYPAATNPAMTSRFHAEGELRRFVDRNRSAAWCHESSVNRLDSCGDISGGLGAHTSICGSA